MLVPKDQQIEALLDKRSIKSPQLRCTSNNVIERFCTNETCERDALCCDEESCKDCEQLHEGCSFAKFKQLTKRLQERHFLHKKFLRNLLTIQNELIKRLTSNREQIMKNQQLYKFEDTIESIYFKNNPKGIKGKEMKVIFASLALKGKEIQSEQCLDQYKKEGEKVINSLINKRQSAIKSALSTSQRMEIDSKILKQSNEKIVYLLRQLNTPSKLSLLYRASQNNFSSAKFHEKCNDISGTVVVARTQHGKTLAAYTSLKWKSIDGWVQDKAKTSFLLQLDLQEKMTLINPEKAIYDGKDFGPIFGGGHDLCITNRCNEGNNTYSNLGHSYNFNNKYVLNNQNSWTLFSGAVGGCKFKITQYQVFQVIK